MSKKVSIIVPCFNVEKYVQACIESILKQNYHHLEVLLIDDGSTDGTRTIIDRYEEKDDRIKAFHKSNSGLSGARNFGLQKMTGDYVCFVDSDDLLPIDYISTLVGLLEDNAADISVVISSNFNDGQIPSISYKTNVVKEYSPHDAVVTMFYQKDFESTAWGKMFHAKLWHGIFFPVGCIYEDLPIIYKVFLRSNKVVFNKSGLYFYRQRENSIMSNPYSDLNVQSAKSCIKNLYENEILLSTCSDSLAARCVSLCFNQIVSSAKDNNENEYFISFIKRHRFAVLRNSRARMKTRTACMISYVDFELVKCCFRFCKGVSLL